jgi:ABC-2 type transport system ATP-binding protein
VSATAIAAYSGVCKRFGQRPALVELSLEIHAGEVFGLLGPNGAGKTTALRLLCGLLTPDSGRVEIAGHDLATHPLLARRQLGYVPDGAPLYSNLTPFEHLCLVGRLHGLEESRLAEEARRLLAALELSERSGDPVGGFSRGMRQKVAIACALLPRPKLLVLDEPMTGLDIPSTMVVKALMRGWADRGGAILVTSHLLELVERVCDRICILSEGRRLAIGTLAELRLQAGGGSTLEEVFRSLTRSEDPETVVSRILGQ